jgi:4-alpha-glucanotransferase
VVQRPFLHLLAQRHGILPSYIDQQGQRHDTPDESYVALLAALGVDAATERAAQRRIAEEDHHRSLEIIAPVQVTQAARPYIAIDASGVPDHTGPIEWDLEIRHEDGTIDRASGRSPSARLPRPLPPGYHTVIVRAGPRGAAAVTAEQALIVTPRRCMQPRDVIGARRVFGLLANLYTVRSSRNWGLGDCADLHSLINWSGDIGAAFVGINPLHAVANRGPDISPYNPVSRLFRNLLYLDIGALPELPQTPNAVRRIASSQMRRTLAELRATHIIDYERILQLKLGVLRLLHRTFVRIHRDGDTARGRAYRRYCQSQGRTLRDFATFAALQDHWSQQGRSSDWRRWPVAYRDCNSREVGAFRQRHRDRVEFHYYLQFALDQQLAHVAGAARRRDLPIGVYQDLAIGSAADGSDTWAFRDLFVDGVSVGAPPDNYNSAGQNWSFPPLNPQRLRARSYDYYARLLRAGLRHAGALRIDHVMGMVRQYWIPEGAPAHAGAYVRVASDDLFGILALESERAKALIVGEDLGTVPPELPPLLKRWGVLSTRVFYFERDRRGAYRPARRYPTRALVSANTHDLPPVIGFLEGRDLTQQAALGLLTDAALARAQAERANDTRAILRQLKGSASACGPKPSADGSALPGSAEAMPSTTRKERTRRIEIRDAIHAFLARTPAALLGIALDDLAAERDAVNVPGVGVEQHPNWSRRMGRTLASLRRDPAVARSLRGARDRRWKKAHRPR